MISKDEYKKLLVKCYESETGKKIKAEGDMISLAFAQWLVEKMYIDKNMCLQIMEVLDETENNNNQ